jgi:1-acyl-sn-glycerol-3-phosphate acyltransferase
MKDKLNTIVSYLFYIYFFLSSVFFLGIAWVVMVCTSWFDPLRRIVAYYISAWAFHYIWINPGWKLKFEGRENINRHRACVYVVNHQSLADINLLYGLFTPFKWVSKEELFKMPIIGWNLILNECIRLKRGDRKSIIEMMKACEDWLRRGACLVIFPEGTRTQDGEIHDFKDGAFRLAVECNVPVQPIVLDGTYDIITKTGRSMNFNADIRVKILPEVDPSQFSGDIIKMKDYVHDLMVDTLADMREGKKPVVIAR